MSRSLWKGPYIKQIGMLNQETIISRSTDILPKFVGLSFLVHDGRSYKNVDVNKEMIGHKFGEFVNTRAKYIFKKKKQKPKKKKK